MKWILIFLCLPAFGQLPVLPFAPSIASSATFEPTNYPALFIYLTTDRLTSITNLANATTVKGWTNIAPVFGSTSDTYNSSGTTILFDLPGPTVSIGAVNFICTTCVGGSAATVKWLNSGTVYNTNQPVTWHFVASYTNDYDHSLGSGLKFGDFTDANSGGRQISSVDPSTGELTMFAGTSLLGSASSFNNFNTWMVFTVVFNGASSAMYTNGVLYVSGNAGANSLGGNEFGTDLTRVTQFMGRMACVLAYGSNQPPATITAVVSGLRSRFGI